MNSLKIVGPLSGYKLNLKWKTEYFKYLGVILPKDLSRIFEKIMTCCQKKKKNQRRACKVESYTFLEFKFKN